MGEQSIILHAPGRQCFSKDNHNSKKASILERGSVRIYLGGAKSLSASEAGLPPTPQCVLGIS